MGVVNQMRFALVVLAVALVFSCVSASSVEICVNVNDSSNSTSLATGSCDSGEETCTSYDLDECINTVELCNGTTVDTLSGSQYSLNDNDQVVVTVFQFSNCTGTNTSATLGTCDGSCTAGITYNCGSSVWIWVIVIVVVIVVICAIVAGVAGFMYYRKRQQANYRIYDEA